MYRQSKIGSSRTTPECRYQRHTGSAVGTCIYTSRYSSTGCPVASLTMVSPALTNTTASVCYRYRIACLSVVGQPVSRFPSRNMPLRLALSASVPTETLGTTSRPGAYRYLDPSIANPEVLRQSFRPAHGDSFSQRAMRQDLTCTRHPKVAAQDQG